MSSDIVWSGDILTGPKTFPLWKVKVISKLCSSKAYVVVSATDVKLIAGTTGVSSSDILRWIACNEKAHGIIQEHLSDALLLKTEACASAKELWEKLRALLDAPNISSTFYIFQQLFSVSWDSMPDISEHITLLWNSEFWLAAMKFSVDTKIMAFLLLNSLPKTLEWDLLKASLINTTEDAKLMLDGVENQVIAENACLCSARKLESAMKASATPMSLTRPPNSSTWCEHHLSGIHNSADCHNYKKWVMNLRSGAFRRPYKGKEKANKAEGTLDVSDSTHIVTDDVSKSLI